MADIMGQPMLWHVMERCGQARGVEAVVACSDSELVLDAVRSWGHEALGTSEQCSSGS